MPNPVGMENMRTPERASQLLYTFTLPLLAADGRHASTLGILSLRSCHAFQREAPAERSPRYRYFTGHDLDPPCNFSSTFRHSTPPLGKVPGFRART